MISIISVWMWYKSIYFLISLFQNHWYWLWADRHRVIYFLVNRHHVSRSAGPLAMQIDFWASEFLDFIISIICYLKRRKKRSIFLRQGWSAQRVYNCLWHCRIDCSVTECRIWVYSSKLGQSCHWELILQIQVEIWAWHDFLIMEVFLALDELKSGERFVWSLSAWVIVEISSWLKYLFWLDVVIAVAERWVPWWFALIVAKFVEFFQIVYDFGSVHSFYIFWYWDIFLFEFLFQKLNFWRILGHLESQIEKICRQNRFAIHKILLEIFVIILICYHLWHIWEKFWTLPLLCEMLKSLNDKFCYCFWSSTIKYGPKKWIYIINTGAIQLQICTNKLILKSEFNVAEVKKLTDIHPWMLSWYSGQLTYLIDKLGFKCRYLLRIEDLPFKLVIHEFHVGKLVPRMSHCIFIKLHY